MVKAIFTKAAGNVLIGADPEAEAFVQGLAIGAGVSLEAKRVRNVGHHRKFFALLGLAFDMWEPPEDHAWNGQPIRKDFDRFRKDVLITAGFYEQTFGFDGTIKLEAMSISFASCDQVEFDRVYKAVLDVVWERVFREAHFRSKDEIENTITQLLSYGS